MSKDWRRELDAALGRPLSDDEWRHLKKASYIAELEQLPKTFDQVVAQVAELRATFGGVRRGAARVITGKPRPAITREEAVSRIYAATADQDDDVRGFRAEALGGALIPLKNLEAWIRRQAEADGVPDVIYEIPVSAAVKVKRTSGKVTFAPPIRGPVPAGMRVRLLAYPKDTWTAHVRVKTGGVLDSLRSLGQSLSGRYWWQDAQATAFVLSGAVPYLGARVTVHQIWPAGLCRLILDVDPRVSPRALSRMYAQQRRELLGARYRNLTAKHLRLAVFVAERPENETWSTRMAAWNKDVAGSRPGWAYTRASNFGRDGQGAVRRLLQQHFRT